MTASPTHIKAVEYWKSGLAPVPIPQGEKGPGKGWPSWRMNSPDDFPNGPGNVGIILGAASGGLICVDLDDADAVELASEFLPPTEMIAGRTQVPRGHWFYRVDCAFKKVHFTHKPTVQKIIEILGDGQQVVVGPSIHPSGDVYDDLTGTATTVDADDLVDAVRRLYEAVCERKGLDPYEGAKAEYVAQEPRQYDPVDGDRPGDDFNNRGDVRELLIKHGWKPGRIEGNREHWTRPGKNYGVSATLADGRVFYVFTSSTILESGRGYSPFSLYVELEHNGDSVEAATELARQGFGSEHDTSNVDGCPLLTGGEARVADVGNTAANSENDLRGFEDGDSATSSPSPETTSDEIEDFEQFEKGCGDWPKPLPLTSDRVEPLPVDAIPATVRNYLVQLAGYTQTPIDLGFGMWLAAMGTALQKKFAVNCGWTEQLSLYVLALMDPANRKSAVVQAISEPIRKFEEAERKRALPGIREARTAQEIQVKQRAKLIDDAVKEKDSAERQAIEAMIRKLDDEISSKAVPSEPSLLVDDVTPERMVTVMAANDGRLGVLTAEGDLFEILTGRYSKQENIGNVLRSHCGDEIRVDRGNRASELIRHPALSIGMCCQPEVLRGLLQKKQLRGKGLMARLLFQIPTSLVGSRDLDAKPIDPFAEVSYQHLMNAVLQLPLEKRDGEIKPTTIRLSSGAAKAFRAFRGETEEAFLEFNSLSNIQDWGGKRDGAVARIACIFHLATNFASETMPTEISEQTMSDAILIGRYLTSHALLAFQVMGRDETVSMAERIAELIKNKCWSQFSRRDAHQAMKVSGCKPEDLDEPLKLLSEYSYIREVETPSKARGRKPTARFDVNPRLINTAI